jgi:hypothetical protein
MLGEMLGESTPTAYEDIIEYALPNDVFLYCTIMWDWRDKSHRWVIIRINPRLR